MVDRIRRHRSDDGELVGHAPEVRKDFRDFVPRLSPPTEGKLRSETGQALPLQLGDLLAPGEGVWHGLPVQPGQFRLGVERLQVGGPPGHVEINDALGADRQLGKTGEAIRSGAGTGGGSMFSGEQAGQGGRPKAHAAAAQKGPAGRGFPAHGWFQLNSG